MTTRRSFLAGASALALTHPLLRAAQSGELLIIGTETQGKSTSKGIYFARFNSANGSLTDPTLAFETPAPTFLALTPNKRMLYALNETSGDAGSSANPAGSIGMVTSLKFNSGAPSLNPVNHVTTAGAGPVYVSTDRTGKCVFAANYGGGSIASYRIEADGGLSQPVSTFTYSAPADQPKKHSRAHRVTVSPDNKFLLVNDLGLDRIHIYRLNAAIAQLTPYGEWAANPGDGPRALRFHANGKIAYCVNETAPTVHTLAWNASAPEGSQLTKLDTVQLAPTADACHPGDIVLDTNAGHAYVSTRRDNTVASFLIAADGTLKQTGKVSSGGVRPRDLTLDPSGNWVLVANQDSGDITVLRRDRKTGLLAPGPQPVKLDQPMCLLFPYLGIS